MYIFTHFNWHAEACRLIKKRRHLRFYGTPVDINMDKSSLYRYSKSPLLESSNFKTIDKKKNIILKDFGKVKIIRTPAGFDLVT